MDTWIRRTRVAFINGWALQEKDGIYSDNEVMVEEEIQERDIVAQTR